MEGDRYRNTRTRFNRRWFACENIGSPFEISKFLEYQRPVELTLSYLLKLSKWAEAKTIAPSEVLTKKEASEMNKKEKFLRMVLKEYKGHVWEKGNKFYQFVAPSFLLKVKHAKL